PAGRAAVESFFGRFCADELRGLPKLLHAPGHSFSDVARKVVSIINLTSVVALETAAGAPVDPLRFRGNVYIKGWPAWHEFDLGRRRIAGDPHAGPAIARIARARSVFFDVHASLPQPARSALSARPGHPPRVSRHGGAQSVARKGPPR